MHQSKVTEWTDYEGWDAFVTDFLARATYPTVPTNKFETYGWTPTLFEPTQIDAFDESAGWEIVRHGNNAADTLSLFIADLDNHTDDQPRVSFEAVSAFLTDHGLSHLLYTSFSHTDGKHKVRIVTPVSRLLTPDEAFKIFTVMNATQNFQLDGSIYDPGDHLYGPNVISRVHRHDAGSLDVDQWLAVADQLPEAIRDYVVRPKKVERRVPTAEELSAMRLASESHVQTANVSIYNPAVFNPAWFDDLHRLYVAGTHRQTALGLLTRAWIKSSLTLTRADLEILQDEIDAEYHGYLRRKYGATELANDIIAAMKMVPSNVGEPINKKQQQIEKEIARLNKRRA